MENNFIDEYIADKIRKRIETQVNDLNKMYQQSKKWKPEPNMLYAPETSCPYCFKFCVNHKKQTECLENHLRNWLRAIKEINKGNFFKIEFVND